MMFHKYFLVGGLVGICGVLSMDNSHTSELSKDDKKDKKSISRYLKVVGVEGSTKSAIHNFFSKDKGEYGGECLAFNVAVKLIIDGDCKKCFDELLQEYDMAGTFLDCRSEANGKTILHHMYDFIDQNNFMLFFKHVSSVLKMSPSLAKVIDKNGNLPKVKEGTLSDFDNELLNNLFKNHHVMNIVPKSLVLHCIASKKFEEIDGIIKSYDLKKQSFFDEYIDLKTQQTFAHFIVSRMNKENFHGYEAVLSEILKSTPALAQAKDKAGKAPFDYVNQNLLDDQKLTQSQLYDLQELFKKEAVRAKSFLFWLGQKLKK